MALYLFVGITEVQSGPLPDDIIHSTTSIHIIQRLPHVSHSCLSLSSVSRLVSTHYRG